ncbi:hypothetical protein ALP39_01714 [Pseudomonas marginalis pv. marginalis]|nr:hypothetical protein ALP39_01714 [Pseudomonas marginalis pv. marginalis]VVM56207.1 hypothetical protein PS664_01051 [Pseudomonas fluorescens]
MAITIDAIRNMLNMARGHESLKRLDAEGHEFQQMMDKLSQNNYGAKIEMPAEDTNRPIQFDEPKKNPP